MRVVLSAAILALVLATNAAHAARAGASPLDDTLRRAASYVRRFEQEFASVLLDEVYDQHQSYRQPASVRTPVTAHRQLRSEMLFMRVPGQGLSWLTARNVLEVDGQPVPDSADRLERAIKGTASGLTARLRSVADESARFNLGDIYRNFNDPNLALLFLDSDYQRRFAFHLEGEEWIDTFRSRRISYKETAPPTIIKEASGRNLFASGSFWVVVDDGIVVRTELATHHDVEVKITVDYRFHPKIGMWIPSQMIERYFQRSTREDLECTATYSNPRRFETFGRVIGGGTPE